MSEPPSRPSVLIFATGGTIGMRHSPNGLVPDPDFEEALQQIVASICEPLGIDFRINHLNPAIDSANADAHTAPRIARLIRARVLASRPRGVVITHGTDTMAYTAARLAFELSAIGAPVVLTGSQLPHTAAGSDVTPNLTLAIRAAVRASVEAPVSIAFDRTLLPAVRTTKFHTDAAHAFRAERDLAPRPSGVPSELLRGTERSAPARVISFRFVPGITAEDLRAAVGGGPDGLVLECYGSGNAPMSRPGMKEALQDICSRLPVVAITQCAVGGIDSGRYKVGGELAETGVLDGGDMTLEAALAKLSFGIDAGLEGAPLGTLMQLNLVGERH